MEQVLIQVGLPVKCAYGDCDAKGNVKPKFVDPEYGGWYKSELFRRTWYCPDHASKGLELNTKWHDRYATLGPEETPEKTLAELYDLLDTHFVTN